MNISLPTDQFRPITLEQMKKVKLMNRIDTKYLIPLHLLPALLDRCTDSFYLQEVDGKRINSYETLYYDTASYEAYLLHLHGHSPRQKVRTRTYLGSNGLTFFEIKNKTNKGRTKKVRTEIPREFFDNFSASEQAIELGENKLRWPAAELSPSLLIHFDRLTLVNNNQTERITIDLNLHFTNPRTQRGGGTPDIAVIELKRDGAEHSAMQNILLDLRVFPAKFSKYCTGIMLTDDALPRGRFKERLVTLKKISENHA